MSSMELDNDCNIKKTSENKMKKHTADYNE